MADEAAMRSWVLRVLRVDPASGGKNTPQNGYLAVWRDAKDSVDTALGTLSKRLRTTGDPDLERIAEYGLYGASEGENVALMAALREAEADPKKGAEALAKAIEDYRDFLAESEAITLIDKNPFGVAITMRATLGAALDELEQRLAA
jgi:hypothetical protein